LHAALLHEIDGDGRGALGSTDGDVELDPQARHGWLLDEAGGVESEGGKGSRRGFVLAGRQLARGAAELEREGRVSVPSPVGSAEGVDAGLEVSERGRVRRLG